MADRKKHKYLEKIPTKNGKYRYIYADSETIRNEKLRAAGGDLIDSVKQHVSDEFHNKFTESVSKKAERQKTQRREIIDKGKRFIDTFFEPLNEYR